MSPAYELVNGFIKSELEDLEETFYHGYLYEYYTRAIAIPWVCYFFKDVVFTENEYMMLDFIRRLEKDEKYEEYGWNRLQPLDAAVFILNRTYGSMTRLFYYLDTGASGWRANLLLPAGLLCPLLDFNNYLLKRCTEINLEHSHFYCEENVYLLMHTRGAVADKLEWIEGQKRLDKQRYHNELFENILKPYSHVHTTFFSDETGFKIRDIKAWMWMYRTAELVYFEPSLKRDYK